MLRWLRWCRLGVARLCFVPEVVTGGGLFWGVGGAWYAFGAPGFGTQVCRVAELVVFDAMWGCRVPSLGLAGVGCRSRGELWPPLRPLVAESLGPL